MKNEIGRRSFLGNIALAAGAAAGAQALLNACGGSSSAPAVPVLGGNCATAGSQMMVSGPSSAGDGHTHTFSMTGAEITAASASASFNTGTTLSHTHPVTLSAAQYASLSGNQGIATTTGIASDGDSHTHPLVINCAG